MPERPAPLPPLHSLRAFEAAARLQSFTRAADEMSVTQGAVSRQIRNLEQRLGVTLFARVDRGVRLTPVGEHYFQVVSESLLRIARATTDVALGREGGPITVGATTAIASLWLMPHLTGFRRAEPELDIRVLVSDESFDRMSEDVDLLIEYTRRAPSGDDVTPLFPEEVMPVCSPDYLGGREPPATPAALLDETLLVLDDDHPDWMDWAEWLDRFGIAVETPRSSVRVNSYPALLQAAIAGQGIALGWRHLVDEFLAAGTLVALMDAPMEKVGAFHVRLTHPVPNDSPVARLRDWLARSD
jgi:LysR family glycine cleavage system transcriptional activator